MLAISSRECQKFSETRPIECFRGVLILKVLYYDNSVALTVFAKSALLIAQTVATLRLFIC